MNQQFVQELHHTLEQTTAPDTEVIKNATVRLNTIYFKNPQVVAALFEIGTSSPNVAVKQLALVELRKRATAKKSKQWLSQTPEVRTHIKTGFLAFVPNEPSAPVRAATARVIAALARIELSQGTWPELLPWLWNLAVSAKASDREVALQTLYMVLDTVVISASESEGGLARHFPSLLELFSKSINDAECMQVRVWTVRCLGKLAEFLDSDDAALISSFQAVLPTIVAVLSHAMDSDDEPSAKAIFDVLETLSLLEVPIISPHMGQMIEFLCTASGKTNYDSELRVMSLNSLLWLIKFKKAKVQSLNIAGAIINALLPIGAEEEPADVDEDVPARAAFRVLDTLATSLPPSQVFPPLFERVQAMAASPDPTQRKSAITAFGVVVEGCSFFIQPHLDSLWPLVTNGLGDSEAIVRKAACTALGCLCEMLEDECAKQHAILLPLIFNLINQPETQRSACVALDCLLEVLGQDIEPYIPSLMESLIQLLDTAPISLKGTVVGAIGSAAHASKEKFIPYFPASMERLIPFLSYTQEGDELDLRGVAQDTVGTLAESVGKELFRPYYEPLMQAAMSALAVPNSPQLKECSYIFFAVMARVFEEEFASYLPVVMPILLASIEQSAFDFDDENNNGDAFAAADVDDDHDFEDLDEEIASDDEDFYANATGLAIEQECAADAIGEIFTNTKTAFLPYLERTVKGLIPGLGHPFLEGIRKSTSGGLLTCISTLYELQNPPKWTKGISNVAPLPADVAQLAEMVLPDIFKMWESEESVDVAYDLCNSLSSCLMSVGPALIAPNYLLPIGKELTAILRRQALCQIEGNEDEDEADAEQSEYDMALIGGAADLIGTLATVLGPEFNTAFESFIPDMGKYFDAKYPLQTRSTVAGAFAEIVNGLESGITPFTETLFQIFLTGLNDPEAEVKSNAAFGIASLMMHSQTDITSQNNNILAALHPLLTPTEGVAKEESACDNACGAIACMIMRNPAAVPLEQVVPIFVDALPPKRDFEESGKIVDCLFTLFQAQTPAVFGKVDKVLAVLSVQLGSVSEGFYPGAPGAMVTEATRNKIVELIRGINATHPANVAAANLSGFL